MIRHVHPDTDLNLLPIPDPGVKKAPDPGSGSATLPESQFPKSLKPLSGFRGSDFRILKKLWENALGLLLFFFYNMNMFCLIKVKKCEKELSLRSLN
jgi:hypothetical protein